MESAVSTARKIQTGPALNPLTSQITGSALTAVHGCIGSLYPFHHQIEQQRNMLTLLLTGQILTPFMKAEAFLSAIRGDRFLLSILLFEFIHLIFTVALRFDPGTLFHPNITHNHQSNISSCIIMVLIFLALFSYIPTSLEIKCKS